MEWRTTSAVERALEVYPHSRPARSDRSVCRGSVRNGMSCFFLKRSSGVCHAQSIRTTPRRNHFFFPSRTTAPFSCRLRTRPRKGEPGCFRNTCARREGHFCESNTQDNLHVTMSDGLQQRGEGKTKARPEDDPLSVLDESGEAAPLDEQGESARPGAERSADFMHAERIVPLSQNRRR